MSITTWTCHYLSASLEQTLAELAAEIHLDVEAVPLADFSPLPPGFRERHRLIGRYSQLRVYVFDPYSIALSKIARCFESDLEDVMFLLDRGLIEFELLEQHFITVVPEAPKSDIDPEEFRAFFAEVKRRHVRR